MKRHQKNHMIRVISRNSIFIISGVGLLVTILVLVLGFLFAKFSTLFFLVPICVAIIFLASLGLLLKNPWLIPQINYWLNKKKLEQEVEVFKQRDNKSGLALSLIVLGALYGGVRKHEIELDYYLHALAILKELEKLEASAVVCQPVGSIYEKYNEFDQAEHYFELGLALSKKVGDMSMIHDYNILLGEFFEKRGMDEKAWSYYTEADQIKKLEKEVNEKIIQG